MILLRMTEGTNWPILIVLSALVRRLPKEQSRSTICPRKGRALRGVRGDCLNLNSRKRQLSLSTYGSERKRSTFASSWTRYTKMPWKSIHNLSRNNSMSSKVTNSALNCSSMNFSAFKNKWILLPNKETRSQSVMHGSPLKPHLISLTTKPIILMRISMWRTKARS
jgi:hypothetical protein